MELRPFILSFLFWTFFATIAVVAGISTIFAPRHAKMFINMIIATEFARPFKIGSHSIVLANNWSSKSRFYRLHDRTSVLFPFLLL